MLHELLHRGDEDRLETQVNSPLPLPAFSTRLNELWILPLPSRGHDLSVCGKSARFPRRESKIASSEKMRIGGTAEMAWMQICDPSDKEKGHYSIEVSDGATTHTRTFDLSGQGKPQEFTHARLRRHTCAP